MKLRGLWQEIRWNWKYWLSKPTRYIVITAVPRYPDDGNMSDELLYKREFKTGFGPEGDTKEMLWTDDWEVDDIPEEDWQNKKVERARLPVFELGELLIVNRNGREITGRGRKPWKWDVGYEEFLLLRSALKCAKKVLKSEL